mgnify:CR=1 FL=1
MAGPRMKPRFPETDILPKSALQLSSFVTSARYAVRHGDVASGEAIRALATRHDDQGQRHRKLTPEPSSSPRRGLRREG